MYDWNDLRFFLAVARSGSTLAASRMLKVSQATVSRRITLFEEALGVELFVRNAAGYALTARGTALTPHAESVEAAAGHFAEAAGAEARRLSGVVRLTTVESAANAWVIPAIARLHELQPGVQVEIIATRGTDHPVLDGYLRSSPPPASHSGGNRLRGHSCRTRHCPRGPTTPGRANRVMRSQW